MSNENLILHNRLTGKISNAGLFEKLGINLMSLGAMLTRPIGHVGYSLIAKAINLIIPNKRLVSSRLFEDAVFAYPYGDLYWSRLAYNNDVYAEDMENFLQLIRHVDYAFIDCGANFGFMSVIITSKTYGEKPAIAIEADPNTFKYLQRNLELNDNRFEIRHNAIFSTSGETVNIYGDKHEARSIVPDATSDQSHGNVETLAVDDLTGWLAQVKTPASILKLDVEGVEIDALKGATKLLETDCMVYYEDHAADHDHAISRYIMDELGLKIFAPDQNGRCRAITDLKQLSAIKTNKRVGYDFVATKSEMWLKEIEKLRI